MSKKTDKLLETFGIVIEETDHEKFLSDKTQTVMHVLNGMNYQDANLVLSLVQEQIELKSMVTV
jgi:hypothetical protein